jgi:glucokinase
MLLVGDIGGTKTDLALCMGKPQPETQATFRSDDFASLEDVIQTFLSHQNVTIHRAIFGVAGPVIDGQSKVTNLPWRISEAKLRDFLQIPVAKLLNDLEAIGYAIPHLTEQDLAPLNEQMELVAGRNKAVIAPGTGLGEGILFYHHGAYHVVASEGGHTDFAPTNPLQIELLRYLLNKFDHVSYERVCSGALGIPNIYSYLKESKTVAESSEVAEALRQANDPTPIIVNNALKGDCNLCAATLDVFVSILGAEAGNLALKAMATGGIYLGGGIPPKILPKLKNGAFMKAFVKKGRFADTLARIPIYVILNEKPALLGAAYYGLAL